MNYLFFVEKELLVLLADAQGPPPTQRQLPSLWTFLERIESPIERGFLFQRFVGVLFRLTSGFLPYTYRNKDVIVENASKDEYWRKQPSYILCECKWTEDEVPLTDVEAFVGKLEQMKTISGGIIGIFVSVRPLAGTGSSMLRSNGILEIRLKEIVQCIKGRRTIVDLLRQKIRLSKP